MVKEKKKKIEAPKKTKTTIYIPEEIVILLDDVFINRMRQRKKVNRSKLICEAIRLLHDKEKFDNADKRCLRRGLE